MKAKTINLKRIISYLLIFSVFFTTMQIGSIKKVFADDITRAPGITLHMGNSTGEEKNIDKDSAGNYICQYLPLGQSFYLVPQNGYTITNVTSSNSGNMSVSPSGTGTSKVWTISSIKDYTDFTLTVSVQDNSGNAQTYKVKLSFDQDTELQFDHLEVAYDNDDPVSVDYTQTNSDGNYYLGPINSSYSKATIKMYDADNNVMTCKINGLSSNTVTLSGGDNVITITRTYLGISRDYKLIINKKGVPGLKALAASTGTLSPAFTSDTYDYDLTVVPTVTTIAFTPTSIDSDSTIKVNGSTVTSGSKSKNISLDYGDNEVEIVVKTTDGNTSTYTVNVIRGASDTSPAQLSGLKLSKGTLSPAFNKDIYNYTATVDNSVTSIAVTPTAVDPSATIKVNGVTVPSGTTSSDISLDVGGNDITVKITKDNESKTYVINVTRGYPKTNANLSSLTVSDGTMSPAFDPNTYLYSVKVDRSVEKVKIKFTAQNSTSKIKIGDLTYASGDESDYIPLNIGANLVKILVTAPDGSTTTTYSLSIIRGSIEGTDVWVLVSGNWTFYDATGTQVKNQWVKYDNQWYFLDINGYMQTGWIQESGQWYYLNDDGIMQTGWIYDKGYWYYLQGDGIMRTNVWATYGGKWYFFNQYGQMQTGWTLYLGRWYYLDEHGVMQVGWVTYDKNKYYLNADGSMKTGWLYSGKVWYYLDNSGMMVMGWQTIDGKKYYFDTNGAMKTGMMFLDGQWINLNNI